MPATDMPNTNQNEQLNLPSHTRPCREVHQREAEGLGGQEQPPGASFLLDIGGILTSRTTMRTFIVQRDIDLSHLILEFSYLEWLS